MRDMPALTRRLRQGLVWGVVLGGVQGSGWAIPIAFAGASTQGAISPSGLALAGTWINTFADGGRPQACYKLTASCNKVTSTNSACRGEIKALSLS